MASATSSLAGNARPALGALAAPVAAALARGPVPLLVFRLPEFERVAWREGKRAAQRMERTVVRAFAQAARRELRAGDRAAHERGSDYFVAAMTAPSRESRAVSPLDCRAVLERIAAAMSLSTELRVETGWTLLRRLARESDVRAAVESALDRGARERERYEFFAAIAHELRTPLTAIRGYLETLLEHAADAATAQRFLETARGETLRMGRLLEGMFQFSLLDLSADTPSWCDVTRQVELACDVVRPLAAARGIALHREAGGVVTASLEPDACVQLAVNLLENAIKYGREGGSVRIAARAAEDEASIVVDDDGPGIVPAERESIFALRSRGSASGGRPGTGIGLAIVKMIAERAGGSIAVRESPMGGARFEARLPLRAEFLSGAS